MFAEIKATPANNLKKEPIFIVIIDLHAAAGHSPILTALKDNGFWNRWFGECNGNAEHVKKILTIYYF